jgi:hypothetical protein
MCVGGCADGLETVDNDRKELEGPTSFLEGYDFGLPS